MIIKSLLITGGCGFIGTSLIRKLLKHNPNIIIRILDNFSTGTPDDLKRITDFTFVKDIEKLDADGIVLIQGDIRDKNITSCCAKGMDCVVHLAANTGVGPSVMDPRLDMDCNVVGTFNMLEAARLNKVKKFIFASSGAPAGAVEPPIHEELAPHPVSPYGASKLAGEGYCSAYYHTFGIDTVCLRFGNVYGPRSKKKSSVVAKFIRRALNDETCEIFGDGSQTRDFIYIEDLVQALILSIEKNVGGETFQIATGLERTVLEVVDLISDALGRRNVKMRIEHGHTRAGDVKRNFSDTTKARKQLDWHAKTELKDGIDHTIDYFFEMKNG